MTSRIISQLEDVRNTFPAIYRIDDGGYYNDSIIVLFKTPSDGVILTGEYMGEAYKFPVQSNRNIIHINYAKRLKSATISFSTP